MFDDKIKKINQINEEIELNKEALKLVKKFKKQLDYEKFNEEENCVFITLRNDNMRENDYAYIKTDIPFEYINFDKMILSLENKIDNLIDELDSLIN